MFLGQGAKVQPLTGRRASTLTATGIKLRHRGEKPERNDLLEELQQPQCEEPTCQ